MPMTGNTPVNNAEWQAQERGLHAARDHDAGRLDDTAANYRVIARALQSSPRSQPPADFAAGVAKRVAAHEAGFEQLLTRVLLAVFLVASLIVGAVYGQHWWHALNHELDHGVSGWVLAAIGCVSLSWLFSRILEPCAGAGRHRRGA